MKYRVVVLLIVGSIFFVASCSESTDTNNGSANINQDTHAARWYTQQQVINGGKIFQQHCASCHKSDASGTTDWRKTDASGKYPPPPLNGTAHTWHHHLDGLRRTVRIGGVPLGGSMPGFADKLDNQEIDEVLAWVQSHWSDQNYSSWQEINNRASR